MRVFKTICSFVVIASAVACGTDPAPGPPSSAPIEIAGTWESVFGGDEVIASDSWTGSTVIAYSNTDRTAILQAPADDMFNPSKFSKNVWTKPVDDSFYFCTVDFGLATEAAASASTKTADASDPATKGCGGFSWTRVLKPIEIRGEYSSNFGGMETITSTSWNGSAIRKIDNEHDFAITQNPADSMFGPNLFNKLVWTEKVGKSFYYCYVDFSRPTLEAAATSTQTADASSPDTSGCGGFSWTKLTAP